MTQRTNAFPDLDRDLRFIPLGVEEPQTLTPGQVRRYNDKGHLFPIDIFSPTEIAEIRAYIDDVYAYDGWNAHSVWCRPTPATTGPTTPAPTAS